MIKFIIKKGDIPAYVLLYKYNSRGCDLYLIEKLKIMREGPELPLKKYRNHNFILGNKFITNLDDKLILVNIK